MEAHIANEYHGDIYQISKMSEQGSFMMVMEVGAVEKRERPERRKANRSPKKDSCSIWPTSISARALDGK